MDNEKKQQLKNTTNQLLALNKKAHDQYLNRTKTEGYEPDFYNEVKPFADELLAIAEEWKTLALEWLNDEHVQYLYPQQITDTFENLTIVSVKAFQKDTRKRRFNEMIQSIDYILGKIIAHFD